MLKCSMPIVRLVLRLAQLSILGILCNACDPEPRATPAQFFAAELPHLDATFTRAQLGKLRSGPNTAASVTLGDETRRAFATTLPSELGFAVEIPPQPRMQVALAVGTLDNENWAPVQFRILVDNGTETVAAFSETVAKPDRNRWLPRDVDLSRWVRQKINLSFQTRVRPADSAGAMTDTLVPLWGSPILSGVGCCEDEPLIVLISIDCLRADHVGAYGYHRDTTPRIDAFAEDGVLFETAVSTAPMTLPSHLSIFTGLFPSLHDGSKWAKLSPSIPYAPRMLSKIGYQTDAVVTGAYLSQTYGFERGFDLYRLDHRAPAEKTADQAIQLLQRGAGRNQFLFVHFIDAHWPYEPPEELVERFGARPDDLAGLLRKVVDNQPPSDDKETERVAALYDAEIRSADEAVGRLLDELRATGLYQRSLIVLTADHGEAFFDHGHWQHSKTLYEELIRIPLIVKWPGQSPKGRVSVQVSQVDIFPTVLAAAGVEPPPTDGIDLIEFVNETKASRQRRRLVSENAWRGPSEWSRKVSIRTERLKYLVTLAAPPGREPEASDIRSEELYNLAEDPLEQTNLAPDSSSDIAAFRRELANYLSEARRKRASRQSEGVVEDDTTKERLRSLGYIN